MYAGVELGHPGYDKKPLKVEITASSASEGGVAEIWMDSIGTGTKIGECRIDNTGGWETFRTFSSPVEHVTGRHDLYLLFTGASGEDLFHLKKLMFVPGSPSEYRYAKTEDQKTILLQLSRPVILAPSVEGLEVFINDTLVRDTLVYGIAETDSAMVRITLATEITKTDNVTISYSGGNILTSDSMALLPFHDESVNNLLPGAPPRLESAGTSTDGTYIELKFTKKMRWTGSPAGDFHDLYSINCKSRNAMPLPYHFHWLQAIPPPSSSFPVRTCSPIIQSKLVIWESSWNQPMGERRVR